MTNLRLADALHLRTPSIEETLDFQLLDRIRQEGGIVLIKLDGERPSTSDGGAYTVVVTKGKLGTDSIRRDSPAVREAIEWVVREYNQRFWRLEG